MAIRTFPKLRPFICTIPRSFAIRTNPLFHSFSPPSFHWQINRRSIISIKVIAFPPVSFQCSHIAHNANHNQGYCSFFFQKDEDIFSDTLQAHKHNDNYDRAFLYIRTLFILPSISISSSTSQTDIHSSIHLSFQMYSLLKIQTRICLSELLSQTIPSFTLLLLLIVNKKATQNSKKIIQLVFQILHFLF